MPLPTLPSKPRTSRRTLPLLAATAALALASVSFVKPCLADTVEFPKEKPIFSIEIPDDWKRTIDKDGDMSCVPPGGSAYSLQVLSQSEIHNSAEMRKYLPELAKAVAEGMKLKEVELGDIEDAKDEGIHFTGLRADGKHDGVAFVLVLQAFEPRKGKWFVLATVGSGDADKAHDDDYSTIAGSITALK